MSRSLTCVVALSALLSAPAHSQIALRPAPAPEITADDAAWYLSREPIVLDGHPYFPTGPVIHFMPHEMARTGWIEGVPLYVRTTREPRSIVYVPLAGGLMRPYERRRDGDLAGTTGSTVPSFPVVLPAAERLDPDPRRAPAPPTGHPVSTIGFVRGETSTAVDRTAATAAAAPAALPPPEPVLRTARAAVGLNAVFVDHDGSRWFASGKVVPFDSRRFQPAGDYHGFTVFAEAGRPDTIYIPVVDGPPGLMTPYRAR
jgi:hypothetical protein